jgi:hypothetical protein
MSQEIEDNRMKLVPNIGIGSMGSSWLECLRTKKEGVPFVMMILLLAVQFTAITASKAQVVRPDNVGNNDAATRQPTALYVTICLWSPSSYVSRTRETAACNEVALTPGVAGPVFESMETCHDGLALAMRNWFAEAGSVFGYKAYAGDGYEITEPRCGPAKNASPGGTRRSG